MRRIGRTLAALGLLVLLAAPAAPAFGHEDTIRTDGPYRVGDMLPPDTVAPFLRWVEARLGREGISLPGVQLSRPGVLAVSELFWEPIPHFEVKGVYTPGRILLDHTTWRWGDPYALSHLVHELVHHVQFETGPHPDCPELSELDAYRIQNEWLALMRLPPVQVPPLPPTACSRLAAVGTPAAGAGQR